jgi:hypothetical protein
MEDVLMYGLILNYGNNNPGASLADGREVICCHFENEFVENYNWQLVFPEMSVAAVLREKNVAVNQLQYVAFCFKPLSYFERIIEKHLFLFPRSFPGFVNEFKDFVVNKLFLKDKLRKTLGFAGPVYYVNPFYAMLYATINSGKKCDFFIVSLKDNPGAIDLAVYKKDNNRLVCLFESIYPGLPLLESLEIGGRGSKRLSIDKIVGYVKKRPSFKHGLFWFDRGNIILRKDYSIVNEGEKNSLILNFLQDLLSYENVSFDDNIIFLSDYGLPVSVITKISEKYSGISFVHKDKIDIIRDVCDYLSGIVYPFAV